LVGGLKSKLFEQAKNYSIARGKFSQKNDFVKRPHLFKIYKDKINGFIFRFNPPSDWLWLEQVEGEWSAFKQIFNRKNTQMDAEIPNLQSRIMTEEQMLDDKIKEIEEMWKTQRPHSGELLPGQALEILIQIETKLNNVKDNYSKVCKAKDLLNLEPGNPRKLETLEEDIGGLKEVWTELKKVNFSLISLLSSHKINKIYSIVLVGSRYIER
jgi:hypothetical protein